MPKAVKPKRIKIMSDGSMSLEEINKAMKYNIIYDEYEAFLPDEGEMISIMKECDKDGEVVWGWKKAQYAKAISSRLRGEK